MTSEYRDKRGKGAPNGQAKTKAARFNDTSFIQYELDKTGQAACKAWVMAEVETFGAIHTLCDQGYSLSIRYDTYSDAYAAFLQQKREDGPNFGYILTGRGSTPQKAVKQLLFKHIEVMGEVWDQFDTGRRSQAIDD